MKPNRTCFCKRWLESSVVLYARLPCDFIPGLIQNAIWFLVTSSSFFTSRNKSLLEDFSPLPSNSEPASVGLNTSGINFLPMFKFEADCNCLPWSKLSMYSLPRNLKEWIAPATLEVVVMLASSLPICFFKTASPEISARAKVVIPIKTTSKTTFMFIPKKVAGNAPAPGVSYIIWIILV